MSLNGINLKMEFIRFYAKIGIIFIAFLDSLHKMGANIVFLVMLLRASSMNTTQKRMYNTLSACCYPHKASSNSIATHKNTLEENQNDIWRLDTETMVEENSLASSNLYGRHMTHNLLHHLKYQKRMQHALWLMPPILVKVWL